VLKGTELRIDYVMSNAIMPLMIDEIFACMNKGIDPF
jgi:hypothetical protein